MTNDLVFAIYMTLAIITAVMITVALLQNKAQHVIHDFVRLCAMVLGWQVVELAYILVRHPFWVRWLFDVRLIFVSFCSVFLLRFIFRFFRMEAFQGRGLFAVLSVIPAITSVLALFSPWHTMLRRSFEIIQWEPVRIALNERGVWFWVHTAYCYLLLVAVLCIVIFNHRSLPRAYRTPSSMMVGSVFATIGSNILVITVFRGFPVDFTLVGMTVALVFVYIAVSLSKQADFLVLARTEIFHYLDDRVFILDTQRRIIDANRSARQWMAEHGIQEELGRTQLDEVVDTLMPAGFSTPREKGQGRDRERYLAEPGGQTVYRMLEREVIDRQGQKLGLFATLADVTRYKLLIDELEKKAGVDPLTGLGNRLSYLEGKELLDTAENLPLGLIIGDVNGLKVVNDTLGHQQGDLLLRTVAALLRQASPPRARIFRIGGDEFVLLLPQSSAEEVKGVIATVMKKFEAKRDLPFTPSIALGGAVKEREDQDYDQLLREADKRMYASKRSDRRMGPPDRRAGGDALPQGMVDRRKGPPDRREMPDRRTGPMDRRDDELDL